MWCCQGCFLSQFCDTEILANCLSKKNSKISQIYTREKKNSKISPKKNPNDKLFTQHFIETLFTELGHHYGARGKNVSKLWEARNDGKNNNK
jgi:hypothetical protein